MEKIRHRTLTAYEQKGLDGKMEELKGSINKALISLKERKFVH